MITALTGSGLAKATAHLRHSGVVGMRVAVALRCYGLQSEVCRFYTVGDGVLMTQGTHALLCGSAVDVDELEKFLDFAGINSFFSDKTLLYTWQDVPLLWMDATDEARCAKPCELAIETAPNLWQLAHSGLLESEEPQLWYGDLCHRANHGAAAVVAVKQNETYTAMASISAMDEQCGYITGVFTAENSRKQGMASALLTKLCTDYGQNRRLSLLCAPHLRRFYEKRGFALHMPACAFERKNPENHD